MTATDWMPHDPDRSASQIQWVCHHAVDRSVLDLGCGNGRIAIPASAISRRYVAVDLDPEGLACIAAETGRVELVEADFRTLDLEEERFDLLLCLGNTFALIWDVDEAVSLLQHWRGLLGEGGMLVLDDLTADCWAEVACGNWAAGVDESGTMQLVWAVDDAVLAVREGDAVNLEDWELGQEDRRMRVWTAGALRLASAAAGFQPPRCDEAGGVLILQVAPV